jgi:hypothetical protein
LPRMASDEAGIGRRGALAGDLRRSVSLHDGSMMAADGC